MTKKNPDAVLKKVLGKLTAEDARQAIFAIRSGHVDYAYGQLCQKLGYTMPKILIGPQHMTQWPGAAALCITLGNEVSIRFRDVKLSESFFTALHEFGHAVYQWEGLSTTNEEQWATNFEMGVVNLANLEGLRADR